MRRISLLPGKLHAQHPGRKWAAAAVIALLAAGLAIAARHAPGLGTAMRLADDVLYDAFYRVRPPIDRTGGDVVMVVVDDASLSQLAARGISWPFPRDLWGRTVRYMEQCGARVVAFDVLFETVSGYDKYIDDDKAFAEAIDQTKVPVVAATMAAPDGKPGPFAPPADPARYTLGAVNLRTDKTLRAYEPYVRSHPSLAVRVTEAIGAPARPWAKEPFRLHYYGPHQRPDGKRTYTYLSAASVFAAARSPADAAAVGIDPAMFKNKVVLVGGLSAGTYDLKSSPLSDLYPGVEVQATAIDNLLRDQRVVEAPAGTAFTATSAGAMVAAALVLLPRRTLSKLLGALLATATVVGTAFYLFAGERIQWLPLAAPMLALLLATVGAFAWSYYTEDRHRRAIVKVFSQYVSPQMAAEIERDPTRIRLTGARQVMTVMFTDIAGFTGLSEKLPDEVLTETLNFYFDQMSPLVFAEDGYLDKYIGDAIMGFWNAPLPQPDHAFRACRAALALERRERQIQPEMVRRGVDECLTRIGINTGPMVVGDMGSRDRFNYTVLGDSVNLGARLEGANKFYGSRILMAQATADLVRDQFLIRKLDVLQVKGKRQPMAVFELLGERGATPADESALLDRAARYEAAYDLYRRQQWGDAEAALRELLSKHPTDGPAASLLERMAELRDHPPGADWNGVYVAKGK